MDHETDWERLARHVAGEGSPDEAAETERWIAGGAERVAAVAEMRTIWDGADLAPAGWDAEAAWRTVEGKLDAATVADSAEPQRPALTLWPMRRRSAASTALRIAAGIVLVAGAGLLATRLQERATEPTAGAAVAMREYITPRGQRAQFNLPDGTQVILSVASRLRVPADYGERGRVVHLDGEAYFEVTHDEQNPFVVHAGAAVARDLGTRFVVRAYEEEDGVRVVVAEGEVALQGDSAGGREALLGAGELGRVAANGEVTTRSGVDLDRYLAWTQGRLVFANTPLREVLPQLGRWYDLDLRLGDSALADLPVTATFKNQPSDDVLGLLALTLGLTPERRGRTVVFYSAAARR